jgi:hypothetical protein
VIDTYGARVKVAHWWTIAGLAIFGIGLAVGPKPDWVTMLLTGVGAAVAIVAERRGGYWQGRIDEWREWQ